MVVMVGQREYGQNSPEIPLTDLEFERTTWGEWKSAHPDTDVCTGLYEITNYQPPPVMPAGRHSDGDFTGE
jgi:hypothetical protein